MTRRSDSEDSGPVAFVTPWSLDDPRSWSGMVRPMLDSLSAVTDVVPISTADVEVALIDRLAMRVLDGRGGKRILAGHLVASARRRGHLLERRLAESGVRGVLGVAASQDLAFLAGPWPVVHVSDATFRLVRDFYPMYSSLAPCAGRQGDLVERRAIQRASGVATATDWARSSVIADYGKPPELVHTVPFGPGCRSEGIERPGRTPDSSLRVLMVSSDWERKGGVRVLEAVSRLREQGLPVDLTVVGEHPALPDWAHGQGRVPPEGMPRLYAAHDVLLELALANAAGVTLTDAAHAGLPVVATHTGGTATIVLDGETGILVSASADRVVAEAVAALRALTSDELLRTQLSARAQAQAVQRLSWTRWASDVLALLDQAP